MKASTAPGFCQTQVPCCFETGGEAGVRGVRSFLMLLVGFALFACLSPPAIGESAVNGSSCHPRCEAVAVNYSA